MDVGDWVAGRRRLEEPVTEGIELGGVGGVRTDRDVVPEARQAWTGRRRGGRAHVAIRGLIDHVISPEASQMVLVVSSSAPLERHAELVLGIDREGRVGVGIARVPDLLLGNESEVVIDVNGDPLNLWLREAVACGCGKPLPMAPVQARYSWLAPLLSDAAMVRARPRTALLGKLESLASQS